MKLTVELVKTYSTKTVRKVHFGPDKEKQEKSTGKEHSPIAKQEVRTSEEHDGPPAEKKILSEGNMDERASDMFIDTLEDEEKEDPTGRNPDGKEKEKINDNGKEIPTDNLDSIKVTPDDDDTKEGIPATSQQPYHSQP